MLATLIAAPLLTTIATATPASACVTDPDPWFGDLGELTLPGNVPYLFTNGDFVLEVDGRRTIYDADLNPLFPVSGGSFSLVGDLYWDGANLRDGAGAILGQSSIPPLAVSPTGTRVLRLLPGDQDQIHVVRPNNTLDTRYSGDGIVSFDALLPPAITDGAFIRIAGIRFVGDTIEFQMHSPPSPGTQTALWVTRLAPGGISFSALTRVEGSINGEARIEVDARRTLLAMYSGLDVPMAAFVDWTTAPAPTVSLLGPTGRPSPSVLPVGDGTGWWLYSQSAHLQRDLFFVTSDGKLDTSLPPIALPIESHISLASPDGSLRWADDNQLFQVKGRQSPALFVLGGLSDQIGRLYRAGLGRDPDQPGLDYWRTVRASGVRLGEIANSFINSPEFQRQFAGLSNAAFVNQLYLFVLGRPADAQGAAFWTGRLNGGMSRPLVLVEFSESEENVLGTGTLPTNEPDAGIYRLYQAYFQRDPDVGGLCHFTTGWTATMPTRVLQGPADFFAASPEFIARYGALSNTEFVRLVYQNVLGRSPDAAGLAYWQSQLASGMSRGTMMVGFSESAEFRLKTDTVPTTDRLFTGGF